MSTQDGSGASPGELFTESVSVMRRLRGPGGCPWDREQTFDSLRKHTLEEAYEVLDAIERRHWKDLCEELGDLQLQVLFHAQVAAEAGYFDIADVIQALNQKLVRRHPHIFGAPAQQDAEIAVSQVLQTWESIKRLEKAGREPSSALDAVPRALPALAEAHKLGSKAAGVGFDWTDAEGVFAKLHEEIAELRQAIREEAEPSPPGARQTGAAAIASELGDLLFSAVNLARRLKVDAELALRGANAKFRRRFAGMEAAAAGPLSSRSPEELEALWDKAKALERAGPEPVG
jgi:XTP/dITP diphosphohydrolase/ATP diphosphatase